MNSVRRSAWWLVFAATWTMQARTSWAQVPVSAEPVLAQQDSALAQAEQMLADNLAALNDLPEPQRIELLRAALWSANETLARRAAARLRYLHLDARESTRVGWLLFPAVLTGDDGASIEEWRSLLGSAEVPRILASWREWPREGTDIHGFMGVLHRALRAEHLGVALGIVLEKDSGELGRWLMEELSSSLLPHTDQDRGRVATALLHYARRSAPTAPPAGFAGLDPRLERLLEQVAEHGASSLPRGSAAFMARWLRQSNATEKSLNTLKACTAMARQDPALGPLFALACIRAATKIEASAATRWLESLVADEALVVLEALAALAHRGDRAAQTSLQRRAEQDAEAFAHLVARDSAAAEAVLVRALTSAPADESAALAQRIGALVDAAEELMLPSPATVVQRATDGLLKKPRRAAVLARVGSRCAELATRERALAALAALAVEGPSALPAIDTHEGLADWAFIESRASAELLELLWRWRGVAEHRELATAILLRAGAAVDAAAVLTAEDELQERAVKALPETERVLIRDPMRAVVADEFATADSKARAMRWLALLGGLPFEVASAVAEAEMPVDVHKQVCDALVAERAIDALVLALPHIANASLRGLGKVRDERVLLFLRELAKQRETRLYAFATGELVRAGDANAISELRQVIADGRYRWLDDEEGAILSCGLQPTEAAHWIQELESNCCRAVVARRVLEDLFGWELPRSADALATDAEFARRWHAAAQGRWAWSVLAGHWLPAP